MFVIIAYFKNVIEYYQIRDSTKIQLTLGDEFKTPQTNVYLDFKTFWDILHNREL